MMDGLWAMMWLGLAYSMPWLVATDGDGARWMFFFFSNLDGPGLALDWLEASASVEPDGFIPPSFCIL
ncbi:hypothetical protein KFK09_023174 [Dendrobium nobile]|uniref:Secreted protein n=1 Tax=Dendrobium nobile TaxID=94219 RepID=A0A8T3AJV7_DENNO|nr:hypothetical protein KFK09_023170 [Dendrobium nobile]KAI0496850.1 hypothetical protein KFK09_023174 [Dendrobium nobile]